MSGDYAKEKNGNLIRGHATMIFLLTIQFPSPFPAPAQAWQVGTLAFQGKQLA